ncbi:MAG: excisionase family DNA binding protein [Rickettsiales bacterium]|jgi:excisionase family DNA binding protein
MKNLNMNLSSQLLTRKEAAEVLGCKENTLAVWATNKRYNLPFYKIGRLVKYKLSDLENFVLQNQHGGSFEEC